MNYVLYLLSYSGNCYYFRTSAAPICNLEYQPRNMITSLKDFNKLSYVKEAIRSKEKGKKAWKSKMLLYRDSSQKKPRVEFYQASFRSNFNWNIPKLTNILATPVLIIISYTNFFQKRGFSDKTISEFLVTRKNGENSKGETTGDDNGKDILKPFYLI